MVALLRLQSLTEGDPLFQLSIMVIMPKVRNMRISFSRKIKAFHATRIGKKRMENKVFMAMYICGVGAFPDPKRSLVTPPDEEVVNRFFTNIPKTRRFCKRNGRFPREPSAYFELLSLDAKRLQQVTSLNRQNVHVLG